jgi:hypothetical protein
MMSDLVKVTVNLTKDNFKTVEKLSEATGMNRTDVINKAIVAEKFIFEAESAGKKFLVEDRNGHIQQVIFR